MKRLVIAFILVTLAELYAFNMFRNHPISLPDGFWPLVTVIQFFMSYGGIESARWLLRKSPVARAPGPDSDWTRLWIWLGAPGGLLMVVSSVAALLVSQTTTSLLPPTLVLGHVAGGGILWLCLSVEMLPGLARVHPRARSLNGQLALAGLFTHLCGLYCYAKLYPAGQLQVGLLFAGVLLTYFVFYYVWAACLCWAVVFRFWKPPVDASEDGNPLGRG